MHARRLSIVTGAPAISDAPATELQLLGTARVRHGGFTADLPDAAAGYLLAVLGARGDWVARDELATLFWPEASADAAQRNLRVTLNRLRNRLAQWGVAAALASERRRLRWLPGSDLVAARAARSRGDWQAAATWLGEPFAVSLGFRGFPVLADWAAGESRAVAALAREAVLRCAANATPHQAAQLAARHLEQDPGNEDVLRLRLQALAALGRHEAVAHEFAAFDAQLRAELGVGASRALAELAARLGPHSSGAAANDPADNDTLVGRDIELARAQGLLASSRLLTLQGLGGVGKTRLAQSLAAGASATLWLSLADATTVAELPHRVLRELNPGAGPARDAVSLSGEALAREVTLLVLDNVEQLLGERAALHAMLDGWLRAAPALRLLVTSRAALGHAAEQVLPLGTLALPEPGGEVLAAPAVRLLVAAALRAYPGFDSREHTIALAQIAQRVGGLPLALRLAGHWLRLLSPADVLAALQRRVGALDDDNAGIQATLDRSWQLLDAKTRRALAALSVFVSPFSAAQAQLAGAAELPALARLSDHGLLDRLPNTPAGEATRLQLHPLVRAYAAERLAADAVAARTAHEGHTAAVQRRVSTWANWNLVDQRLALQDLALLLPEALAAWQWALAQGRADVIADTAPVLLHYFEKRGRWTEGIALFESAEPVFDAALPTELAALAALQRGRALLLYRDGRYDAAAALAARALDAARRLGHAEGVKANLNTVALAHWMLGQLDLAEAAAAQARDLAAATGDLPNEAVFAGTLALLHKRRGRYAEAEACWRRALAVHREVGNWSSACVCLNNLGNLLRVVGRFDEAVMLLDESLRLCDAYGFASSRPFALINLAQAHRAAGRLDIAEPLALQALAEVRRSGERMLEAATLLMLAELALRADRPALCAQRLGPALRLARALNEPANLLEALSGFARWQLACGRVAEAARTVATVLAHPALQAELRDELQGSPWTGLDGLADAVPMDLLVLVELASAELAG